MGKEKMATQLDYANGVICHGGFGIEGIKIEPASNSNQSFVLILWDCIFVFIL